MKSILKRQIITIVLAIVLGLLATTSVFAAVTLLYFRAEPGDQVVNLTWDTANETDTFGYLIFRSTDGTDYGEPDNPITVTTQQTETVIILAKTIDDDTSNDNLPYSVQDKLVTNGVKYWYKLYEIEDNGISDLNEIVTAIPGFTPTPTLIPSVPTTTPTKTPTKTSSSSENKSNTNRSSNSPSQTPTKQPTVFLQATNTPVIQPPTSTPLPNVDAQPVDAAPTEVSATGTPTLEAAPKLTLVLGNAPIQGDEITSTPVVTTEPTEQSSGWISKKGLTIIGVLAAVWLALGGWFFLSFRRME